MLDLKLFSFRPELFIFGCGYFLALAVDLFSFGHGIGLLWAWIVLCWAWDCYVLVWYC